MKNNANGKDSSPVTDDAGCHQNEIRRDKLRTVTALGSDEVVKRYGSAAAEYLKGYRGVDNATGQVFAKGLADIANYKVNPDYAASNIKQQAGFSAEIATTSRDNAEAIVKGSAERTLRSDDLVQYGKNHNVVDRVKVLDGNVIEGSQSQMKFVGNRDRLFKDIADEQGKFARYRGVKLELPSEQFDGADAWCRQRADELRKQAEKVDSLGNPATADKLRREAANYEQLADNLCDSGLTTEQAIFYRKHPALATARDMLHTSHRAGAGGAKYGAIIGGSISLLVNAFQATCQDKNAAEALQDVAVDTAKSAALGYGTAFAGSAIKSVLQQSESQALRTLAGTSAPTLAVNICLSLGVSIKRYVSGEIDEATLLHEVGEKGTGMLSSGMMAALGQIAIPVPVVGAVIGGMIGYTLSSMFYQSALEAARGAAFSRARLQQIQQIEQAARSRIAQEQAVIDEFAQRELPQLRQETERLLKGLNDNTDDMDNLAYRLNNFSSLLGKTLQFNTLSEFDEFMNSDRPLIL